MGENPELLAMARKIVKTTLRSDRHERCNCREEIDSGAWDNGHPMKSALAAIIETQELIAAWLEQYPSPMNDLDMAMRIREICAAIRSGQQFRKDV